MIVDWLRIAGHRVASRSDVFWRLPFLMPGIDRGLSACRPVGRLLQAQSGRSGHLGPLGKQCRVPTLVRTSVPKRPSQQVLRTDVVQSMSGRIDIRNQKEG